jgi:peptide/nickel transport system permease protein
MFIFFIGIKFIIGSAPLICKYKNHWSVPAFSRSDENLSSDLLQWAEQDYRRLNYDFAIWPLMKKNPKELFPENAWSVPLTRNNKGDFYILGSYDLGKDVFGGCLYGLHKSLLIGLLTIFLASVIGIFIGSAFRFQTIRFSKMSVVSAICFITGICIKLYIIILMVDRKIYSMELFLLLLIPLILFLLGFYFYNIGKSVVFKLDGIVLRYLEIMKSIPVIMLLLVLLQIIKNPDAIQLSGLMAIVYIPVIAKYTRAFTGSISVETYMDSLIAIGQKPYKIYIKHVLPELIKRLIPVLAFGIATIIMLEATLSFLGMGLALDEVSLGTMMFAARSNPSAWWVVVFPGLLIFWLILSFNSIGDELSKKPEAYQL